MKLWLILLTRSSERSPLFVRFGEDATNPQDVFTSFFLPRQQRREFIGHMMKKPNYFYVSYESYPTAQKNLHLFAVVQRAEYWATAPIRIAYSSLRTWPDFWVSSNSSFAASRGESGCFCGHLDVPAFSQINRHDVIEGRFHLQKFAFP